MEKEKDNLYLIRIHSKSGNSLIKLGYSGDLTKRLKTYYYHNPMLEVIKTFYSPIGKQIEKEIHSKIKASYLNEWYSEDKLDEILELLNEYQVKNLELFNLQYASEENIVYVGDSLTKEIMFSLTANEFGLLSRFGHNLDRNTNSIPILSGGINCHKIEREFNISRKIIKKAVEKIISMGIIKVNGLEYIMNPSFYHLSRTLSPSVWNYFELTPPTQEMYC